MTDIDTPDMPATREDADLIAYERYVERPRRAGRDPVWESLWAWATEDGAA